MRVSWTFASAELVTIRQLMIPSDIASAIACRSRLCTIICRTSVKSALSPAPARSASAASCSAAAGAGATRSTSLAQRLIVRSSCDAVFYVRVRRCCFFGRAARFVSYLDGKVIDRAPACCASRLVEGLCAGRRALKRCDAIVQSCDLSFLFLELSSLFLDLLMGDGLTEIYGSGRRRLDYHIEEMPAQNSSMHIDTVLQKHYQGCGQKGLC